MQKTHPGKGKPLYRMFNNIPHRYDLMNRMLTLRFDEVWRRKATRLILEGTPEKVMDLCTGTGDLAVRIASQSKKTTDITALDFSENMLDLARLKSERNKVDGRIKFIHGDAANLPFKDQTFDSIGIAFAFRNLTFKNALKDDALSEVYRVLRSGGRFIIVESSQPRSLVMKWIFRIYMKVMVDKIGGLISGHRSAYRYLAYSASHFYKADEVSDMLKEKGFTYVEYINLLGGFAAIHIATK